MRFLSLLLLFLFFGCNQDMVYRETKTISANGWTYDQVLEFPFQVTDTNKLYDLIVEVQHTPEYGWQNLYVEITSEFPGQESQTELLSLELAGKGGQWFGDCNASSCTLLIPILQNAFFSNTGTHTLKIGQAMRENPLVEVQQITLALRDTGETK